jgi:hypothetical protein
MKISRRLRYEDLFEDKPLALTEYLKGINKNDESKLLSLLVNSAHPSHSNNNSVELVKNWFSGGNEAIKTEILRKISEGDSIINITSSLKFAELLLKREISEDVTYSNEEIELNVFKAYLLLNGDQDEIEEAGHNALPNGELTEDRLNALVLAMNFHDYDLTNYDIFEILISQVIKSVEFFNYLEGREELKEHMALFLKKFNCDTWKDWLKQYLALVLPTLDPKSNSSAFHEFIVPNDANFNKNCLFLDTFSLSDDSDHEQADYIGFRSNPLIKVEEGKYRVTNKLFLVEKIFKSIQFLFSLVINKEVSEQSKLKDFRADHCDKFSEQTLLYNTLDKSFPKKWHKISGKFFKYNGYNDAEPDYYVRFRNKIFLFESKDVILKGDDKQSRNSETLLQSIDEKFYKTTKSNGKIEKKAILQLIENIKRILEKYYSNVDSNYDHENVSIYPVLITHDRQFDSLGINKILKKRFEEELQIVKTTHNIKNIKPLTIINIDTFIIYSETFRERGTVRLEELIDTYHDKLGKSHDPFLSFSDFSTKAFNKISAVKKGIKKVMEYAQRLFD